MEWTPILIFFENFSFTSGLLNNSARQSIVINEVINFGKGQQNVLNSLLQRTVKCKNINAAQFTCGLIPK